MLIFTFPFVFLVHYLDKTVIIVKEDFADGWIILNSFLSLHITLNLWIDENFLTAEFSRSKLFMERKTARGRSQRVVNPFRKSFH